MFWEVWKPGNWESARKTETRSLTSLLAGLDQCLGTSKKVGGEKALTLIWFLDLFFLVWFLGLVFGFGFWVWFLGLFLGLVFGLAMFFLPDFHCARSLHSDLAAICLKSRRSLALLRALAFSS